jgi:cation diffusion facilitator family transporter
MGENDSYILIKKLLVISIFISLTVAVIEVISYLYTGSFSILADGIDSIGNFLVSLTVLIGLSYAFKPPDLRFNFGYYKFESLFALFASIINVIMISLVSYFAILRVYEHHTVSNIYLAFIAASISAITAFVIAFYKLALAKKFGLLSLKADAINSIKDSLGSIVAIFGLTLTGFNYAIFDLIAALVISGLVFYASIIIMKESSLILLDACHNPALHEKIKTLTRNISLIKSVREIKLRKLGTGIIAEITIEVDGEIKVQQLKEALRLFEDMIKTNIKGITKVNLSIKY